MAWMLLLVLATISGCQTQPQAVAQREDNLAAAGFVVLPANTPERKQMLVRLPAHQFVMRARGDVVHFIYADPLVCGCLYVGTQLAYNTYKWQIQQQNLANQQQMTAQMYTDPVWNWNAWGPTEGSPFGPQFGFVYGSELGW